MLKNIDFSKVVDLSQLVVYQIGQIVSRTLVQNKSVGLTLFAFDKNEEISSHESTGDAIVLILEGSAEITVGGEVFNPKKDEVVVMPAGVPHAVKSIDPFKMLLTVVFPQ
ncbi:MAG: cupin [Clostridiales bacterium GWF2_36_10]|nr:MAG: cupin [Clostridiales bacterium GWF2_36_10]HAN20513.1 cupin domain-containing protein [Clostridiales bacterium]